MTYSKSENSSKPNQMKSNGSESMENMFNSYKNSTSNACCSSNDQSQCGDSKNLFDALENCGSVRNVT